MTPTDLFMFGLWSGLFWLVALVFIVIISAWGNAWDKVEGAIGGFIFGFMVFIGGWFVTAGILWVAAIVLWIINL